MQQFTVPQFIDVEDKIIGPITTRQFIIMLVGIIFTAIFYKIFDFSLFLLIAVLTFTISVIFAFVKVNSRPFHFFVLNLVQTFRRANLRIWINSSEVIVEVEDVAELNKREAPIATAQPLVRSRLDELSLIVDTQGAYKGEKKNNFQ